MRGRGEILMGAPFYVAAAVAIIATFMTVTRVNAIHALLYLVVSLLAAATVMLLVGAPFAAAPGRAGRPPPWRR
ncbi:MAG: NADH-quinone oxidoreductase subunit J [Syntrophorhabdales bacterium]